MGRISTIRYWEKKEYHAEYYRKKRLRIKQLLVTGVSSSVLILGPETYNNLGSETTLTPNYVPKKDKILNGLNIVIGKRTVVFD